LLARTLTVFIALVSLTAASISCGGGDDTDADKVSLQLDWTPNTNHIGVYVALANGWYEDAGIEVDVLPYTDAGNADAIVANGNADFGISFPPSLIFSRAAGLDLVSVAAVLQKTVSEIAVLDSSDIRRPRDLDGKTYAGFGLPDEEPRLAGVIKADGGSGEFETATLSTAAYQALYNRRADFTEIFTAWEGIEAEMQGIKLRTFRYDTYGIPEWPSVILVAKQENVTKRADVYERFLEVTRRGYEFAAQQPEQAARIFLDYLPEGTFPEPELVTRSTRALAPVYVNGGRWGAQNEAQWNTYARWLLQQGVVVDGSNRVVTELSGGPLFTNALIDPASASR
jgi:ABC-type nitrate/sulfonate/bicarbonate transport system substrate-binding protein